MDLSNKKNLKVLVGTLVIVVAIAYLILSSLSTVTTAYYLKVGEALQGNIDLDKSYRIEGKIDVEKATYNTKKTPIELKFQIYDEDNPDQKLTVIFKDVKPDNFQDATGAIVEGKFQQDGTFNADILNLKCPSKYEAGEPTEYEGRVSEFLRSLGIKS
ncbi:cytochrome c-type biogenesis protein CcmE [Desulfitobacterium dichloroeliminans LMG P-21439]|uniref:Cytochrome c-type biogenesis protein CcmE n=1 Tax=Desulfitobacterium dichloroeliminans (strain LMG P-21439 / DCA1) TaxID=871963 RepID=L0F6S7_DESDL|nr:cytochrome c maturation protein CcmE [Desulfitobacterium dichloroeliminans]AGA68658.1 cytochrome c-type biogenesis protein CcmE [Desulfitobacterium dichloroeliminans LMG P-21439]